MKRGNFLRFTTGGLVTTALAAPALAQTPQQVSWRLQSSYPRSLETLYGACDFFLRWQSLLVCGVSRADQS
jgi:TRAP-type mannitol/chloroaromatic compound transport system substrate-binding protein